MAKSSLILGTAGHIDHGKSSLVKALTGTDPDRLAEEKERGITITLGFAQIVLPSGRKMGVVDVPGHERFVRQMVAGATGMDVALLVVAADDGVMPQTVEHMAVLELLGVKSCVVALTKADLVDADWLEFVADDVRQRLAETSFSQAPVVACSSVTGEGLDELKAALDEATRAAEHTKADGPVRMPIDRVFTVKGFGTVVTGSLWSGTVHIDDELEVLPSGLKTSVRSIQVHGVDKDAAACGMRVALCLRSLSCDDVHTGDFLALPGSLTATDRFDACLTYSDPFKTGEPLESGKRFHIAHGTREVVGRILCMNGASSIAPGETAQVQVRLDNPLPLSYQDRFIVRSYSPVHVIAGGSVLAAHPKRRTTLSASEQKTLDALASGNAAEAIDVFAQNLDLPATAAVIAKSLGLPEKTVATRIPKLLDAKRLVCLGSTGEFFSTPAVKARLIASVENELLKFHDAYPQATGIGVSELRLKVGARLSAACFDALLEDAQTAGKCRQSKGEVGHPDATANAQAHIREAADALKEVLTAAGQNPPAAAALIQSCEIDRGVAQKALALLVEEGFAVRTNSELYFPAAVVEHHKASVAQFIRVNGPATAAQLKEACNTSRKYMVPLLEYFDAQGFTKREGDMRTLR